MTDTHDRPLVGCDELRRWLEANSFRVSRNGLATHGYDECNWYAYRSGALPARECEHNEGKRMQIVVRPYRIRDQFRAGRAWEGAEVEVCGEAGGVWWKLQAYSLTHDELRERLYEIERSLIAAWNALIEAKSV